MIAQDALDLVRGVLFEVLAIAGPVMLIAMLVGFALVLLLPWMAQRLVDYSRDLILDIPAVVSGKGSP
jgi:flagellar biosynthesis protein FliQ